MYKSINDIPFVLGSQSPRRKEIFKKANLHFRAAFSGLEERITANSPQENTVRLAEMKAADIEINSNEILITADTLVALNGKILGKPIDKADAMEMIQSLSGAWHSVFTGVAIKSEMITFSFYEETEVFINAILEQDIRTYVGTAEPYDKAGAYGVQEWFGHRYAGKINGCFYNVMGFPMPRFIKEIEKRL